MPHIIYCISIVILSHMCMFYIKLDFGVECEFFNFIFYIFISSLSFFISLIEDIFLKSRIIVCMISHHHNEFVE